MSTPAPARAPQYILLPVNPVFIAVSLLLALLLNLLPWGTMVGIPDFLAIVLVFWNIHQPRKVGIGIAFLCGLLLDVHDATLLGEHALAYSLLSYGAIAIHRRVLWFTLPVQAMHVLPLFLIGQIIPLLLRLLTGSPFPGWWYFLESFVAAGLWPFTVWMLMAPQRRAIDRDDNRPI